MKILKRLFLKIVFPLIALLYAAVYLLPNYDDFDFALLGNVFLSVLAVFSTYILALFVRGERWRIMLQLPVRQVGMQINYIYGLVFFISTMTPMRIGDILRITYLSRFDVPMAFATGTIAIERLQDMLFLMVLVLAATMNISGDMPWKTDVLISIGIAVVFVYFFIGNIFGILEGMVSPLFYEKFLSKFSSGMLVISDFKTHALLFSMGGLIWILHALGMTLFFQALDYDLPLYTGIAVLAAVNISGLIHLTPGNIGIYEAAGALVLTGFGLGYAEAILIMVVLHLAVMATIGVYGFISGFLLYLKGYELCQDYGKLKSENS